MALPDPYAPIQKQAPVPSKGGPPKHKPKKKGSKKRKALLKAFAKKANPNAPVGQGGRFAALSQSLAGKPGVTNPGGLAAAIGRKKFGAKTFAKLGR